MALEYEEIDLGQVDGTDGTNGREIEMQVSSTHVQWRYKGETAWKNIIALSSITGVQGPQGLAGKKLMLQKTSTHIQYKYEGDTAWTNLIALTDITGPQGLQGTSIRLKGAWVSGTAYVNNTSFIDNVTYGGETYGCIKSHTATASILPTNTTYWIRLTEKGATGTQGIPGVAGKDGNAKIANNLTTTDITYALSALQGKILKENIDKLTENAGAFAEVWGEFGFCGDSANRFELYAYLTITSVMGVYTIRGVGAFENVIAANSGSYDYGISLNKIRTLCNIPSNAQVIGLGKCTYYGKGMDQGANATNAELTNLNGFCGILEYRSSNYLLPSRIHDISGNRGGWQIGVIYNDCKFEFEINLKVGV